MCSSAHRYDLIYDVHPNDTFSIGRKSGELMVNGTALDYEADNSYTLRVEAKTVGRDEGNVMINCTVRVSVVDGNDAPVLTQLKPPRTIEENAAKNDYIGNTFAYTDEDANQEAKFSITGGNSDGLFAIGSCSGQLYLAKTDLDYNVRQNYTIEVTVTDDGLPPLADSGNTTIFVLDSNDAPTFDVSNPSFTIAENVKANTTVMSASFNVSGESVSYVPTSDIDKHDKQTFSLATNDGSLFGVDSETGDLYVKYGPDFEFRSSYSFRLKATDKEGASASVSVSVVITDVNEAPVLTYGTAYVDETVAGGNAFSLSPSTAYDPDAGTMLEYELVSAKSSGVDPSIVEAYFSLDTTTGELTMTGSGADALNYEIMPNYTVTVAVFDNGIPTDESCTERCKNTTTEVMVFVTDVNEPPYFVDNSTTVSIFENASVGAVAGVLEWGDPDRGQTHYFGETLNFEQGQVMTFILEPCVKLQ